MTNRTAAKSAHPGTHGNNQNKDLFGNNFVNLVPAWDISENGKSFVLKDVPLHEVYVKSGLQEKSDIYLHGRAKASHRRFTKAAWNMCCRNYVVHGIWGSDADVERAHERAILEGYTKGVDDVHKRKYNKKPEPEFDGNTLCALFK